jgi:hypothetical protein
VDASQVDESPSVISGNQSQPRATDVSGGRAGPGAQPDPARVEATTGIARTSSLLIHVRLCQSMALRPESRLRASFHRPDRSLYVQWDSGSARTCSSTKGGDRSLSPIDHADTIALSLRTNVAPTDRCRRTRRLSHHRSST